MGSSVEKVFYSCKRIIATFLFISILTGLFTMLATVTTVTAAKANNKNGKKIYVSVNGAKISKNKNVARKIGKKYLVNAKLLAKKMDAKTKRKKNTIALTKKANKNVTLKFTINKKAYLKGKKRVKANIAPRKIGGKIFVSAKAVAKEYGYNTFKYNKKTKTLIIDDGSDEGNLNGNEQATSTQEATETPAVSIQPGISSNSVYPIVTNEPTAGVTPGAKIIPSDKYPVVLYKNMDGGSFFSTTEGSTEKAEGGANGSAAGVKMIAGASGIYNVSSALVSGSTYYVSFYVKGKLKGIYAGDNKTTPTLDLSGTNYDDWTYVQSSFVAGVDVAGKLSVKVVCDSKKDGYIDEFKLFRYVPAGQGSDEDYENALMRVRINAPNFYRIEDYSMKTEKLDATITIDDGTVEHSVIVPTTDIVLEGRGNSTFFGMPKKPLKFKFKNGAQAIGNLPKGKKWNLMAEYYDRTLMRNAIMQNFAGNLPGLDYATRTEFVEVYVNEVYLGVYLLTEAITVNENRVNIDNDPSKENFGFIVEWDDRADDEAEDRYNEIEDKTNVSSPADTYFSVNMGGKYYIFGYKSPDAEDMTPEQREYIRQTVQQVSDSIINSNQSNDYLNYCDLDSFVDFFIVNDFAQNSDAISFASIYLHKDKDGKLKMGPCWDFDIYVGNGSNEPSNKCLEWGSPWFNPLVGNNFEFQKKLFTRWTEIKDTVVKTELINYVNELELKLASAATRNFEIWDTQTNPIFVGNLQRSLAGSWTGEVDYLQTWLNQRWSYANGYYGTLPH